MQEEELSELISKTAALMEQFERRCDGIERRLLASSDSLQVMTQQLPDVMQRAAESSMQTLPGEVVNQVRHGLAKPVADYHQRLDKAGSDIANVAQSLGTQITHMRRLHRLLLWKVVGVTATSFLLLVGGMGLSMHYARIIAENQITADLMRSFNRADVVLCEKNQLCANVDTKGKRYGDHRQYVPVIGR